MVVLNMDMPEGCYECPICGNDACNERKKEFSKHWMEIGFVGRPAYCPLMAEERTKQIKEASHGKT